MAEKVAVSSVFFVRLFCTLLPENTARRICKSVGEGVLLILHVKGVEIAVFLAKKTFDVRFCYRRSAARQTLNGI